MPRRPGYNPTRRNRNIGTSKQGRGRDNRFSIPWPDDRHFADRLVNPVLVWRVVRDELTAFFVERPRNGYVHICTIDDLVRMLESLPREDLDGLRVFVLRQSTRKQVTMQSVWGRMSYASDLGDYSGPAVFLEAQRPVTSIRWPKDLSPEETRELERLRQDGHRISTDRRSHSIHTTLESCRSTMLYRTLPHEIGHYVDYQRIVLRPADSGQASVESLEDRYWSRPDDEREVFAHRYAAEVRERMQKMGQLPFPRLLSGESMVQDGLERSWFETVA